MGSASGQQAPLGPQENRKGWRVAILSGAGIGGMEKAAAGFAVELAGLGWPVWFVAAPGPRAEELARRGVQIFDLQKAGVSLATFLREQRIELLHQHVPGYPFENPVYTALRELGIDAPRLIETNIFGRFDDPEGDPFVAHRTFVSQSSAIQAFRRAHRPLTAETLRTCTAVYNPLPPISKISTRRDELRSSLGVAPGDILAIRVGQPSPGKWTTWEASALQLARRDAPNLRLLLMEPPPAIRQSLAALGPESGILIEPATSDFSRLRDLYAAADVMIHASAFGESFGYTIAEAMQAGLPVIVRSTPWRDNAQVELVENGVTGFVCATIAEMSRCLLRCARNPELRTNLGNAGRSRIDQLANQAQEASVIAAIIESVMTGNRPTVLEERTRALLDFEPEFRRREFTFSESFRSRPREWLQWRSYCAYRELRITVGRVVARLRAARS